MPAVLPPAEAARIRFLSEPAARRELQALALLQERQGGLWDDEGARFLALAARLEIAVTVIRTEFNLKEEQHVKQPAKTDRRR